MQSDKWNFRRAEEDPHCRSVFCCDVDPRRRSRRRPDTCPEKRRSAIAKTQARGVSYQGKSLSSKWTIPSAIGKIDSRGGLLLRHTLLKAESRIVPHLFLDNPAIFLTHPARDLDIDVHDRLTVDKA
jgi:hypothetical protein